VGYFWGHIFQLDRQAYALVGTRHCGEFWQKFNDCAKGMEKYAGLIYHSFTDWLVLHTNCVQGEALPSPLYVALNSKTQMTA
jgi:hypothetical protein